MKKSFSRRAHMVDVLFILALFCVFAASALMVVVIGADVYQGTVRGMERNFNLYTSLNYLTQKVRQYDTEGAVSIGEIEGQDALVLEERVGDGVYQTFIYYWDGALRELFVMQDSSADASGGQEILQIGGFAVEQEGSLFRFTVQDLGGEKASTVVAPRCPNS